MNQGNFQEILIIGCSNETSINETLIFIYDLHTGISITENYIFSNQKEKPIIHVYIWQKENIYQKIFLPETLSVFTISHDTYWAAGGTSQGKLYLWQISSGNLMFVHNAHYQKITAITFVIHDTFFLTGSEDSALCLWKLSDIVDLYTQKDKIQPLKTWNDHRLTITDIVCGFGTVNLARVFTSSLDKTVNIWDLCTQSLLTTFVFQDPVTCLALDPAERAFYAGTDQGNIYLVDLYGSSEENPMEFFYKAIGGSKKIIQGVKDELYTFKGHENAISCMALSFDGSLLITGSEDRNVFVWDIATRQMIQAFKKHNGSITSICCKVIHHDFFTNKITLENIPFFKRTQNSQDMDYYYVFKKLTEFNDLKDESSWYENDLISMKNDLNEFTSITSEPALQLQIKNLQDELQKLYGYYSELRNIHQDLWTLHIKSQETC